MVSDSWSKHFSRFAVRLRRDRAREGGESELTLTAFPRGPFPVTAVLRFRRRVSARTHVRSICMRPAQGAGCKADSKRGCYPLGSRGYNFSPIPETKEEKSRFSWVPPRLLYYFHFPFPPFDARVVSIRLPSSPLLSRAFSLHRSMPPCCWDGSLSIIIFSFFLSAGYPGINKRRFRSLSPPRR